MLEQVDVDTLQRGVVKPQAWDDDAAPPPAMATKGITRIQVFLGHKPLVAGVNGWWQAPTWGPDAHPEYRCKSVIHDEPAFSTENGRAMLVPLYQMPHGCLQCAFCLGIASADAVSSDKNKIFNKTGTNGVRCRSCGTAQRYSAIYNRILDEFLAGYDFATKKG